MDVTVVNMVHLLIRNRELLGTRTNTRAMQTVRGLRIFCFIRTKITLPIHKNPYTECF